SVRPSARHLLWAVRSLSTVATERHVKASGSPDEGADQGSLRASVAREATVPRALVRVAPVWKAGEVTSTTRRPTPAGTRAAVVGVASVLLLVAVLQVAL